MPRRTRFLPLLGLALLASCRGEPEQAAAPEPVAAAPVAAAPAPSSMPNPFGPAWDPAGPEPTTVTRLPDSRDGARGRTHPASKARSAIARSLPSIVTGSAPIPSTHAASHGAGHTRPVNSGKLLVS